MYEIVREVARSVLFYLPFFIVGLGILYTAFSAIRYIPNNKVGIVEKRWSRSGSVRSGLIALHGEAGYQPDVLRGGIHILMPFQYAVYRMGLVTIPQGRIGYVFARDGKALHPSQTLAANDVVDDFQDARNFLEKGGQKGPQRQILREGTYAINLAQFVVITHDGNLGLIMQSNEEALFNQMHKVLTERDGFSPVVIRGKDDYVGVVTVHDGPALEQGEIISPVVGNEHINHNNFQDPENFLKAGGKRGRQLQLLVDGTYFLNRLFATVELIPKTTVEVGYVGVVISYTGARGKDLSGSDYKHGELVETGEKGVWAAPLMPGKYAFNTYAGKVVSVPTTNFILKWKKGVSGEHGFDTNLTEVHLITKDAFEPYLSLSVVVHIDYRKAPLVVQRFGDIKRLVDQTLDPMVSAYFKNVGQMRTLIEVLQARSEIQEKATGEMRQRFGHYNLELEEVLIGTPSGEIESILSQLRSRQIASEQIETYARQEQAAIKQCALKEAEARAAQQTALTQSEVSIVVQGNEGRADFERAQQKAKQIRILAEAEAEQVARVGVARAVATEEQVRAYGGPSFQVTQQVMQAFADAVKESKVEVVPRMLVGGGAAGGGGLLESLMAVLLSDKFMAAGLVDNQRESSSKANAIRAQLEGLKS
jgi:uncharacterized membrane protein YqiK